MKYMFETARLRVRTFEPDDAPRLYAYHLDDAIKKWIPNECYADIEEAHGAIDFFASCVESNRLPYVLAVELKENIALDDSWGELTIFKKVKNIEYYGIGSYTVSLYNLQDEAIRIDPYLKIITLSFSKPIIKECFLQEAKTLYESTENGLLRFGEITLTAEDSSLLRQKVLERMEKKLYEEELQQQAIASTEISLTEIFKVVAQGVTGEDYKVEIVLE